MLTLGWFSTGRGEGSRGLLRFVQERILRRQLEAEIQFVFSNREPGEAEGSDEFFRLVQGYEIPLVTFSSSHFRRAKGGRFSQHREEYDQEVMRLLHDYNPDVGVLAGYMLIVSGAMCRQRPLLNLHPALPDGPTGTWQEVIWSLIAQRAPQTGAMVHLATEEVDRGPLVSYCTAPIAGPLFDSYWQALAQKDLAQIKSSQGEDFALFQLIRQAEFRREPYLLFTTLQAIAAGEIAIRDGQVVDPQGHTLTAVAPKGLCLDQAIDRAMAEEEQSRRA